MAYRLPRQTPITDCLQYLKEEGIIGRIEKRRNNFVERNKNSTLIKYGETLKHSQGRRIRVKQTHVDRSIKMKNSWKGKLHLHKPHLFFSDTTTHPEHEQAEAEEKNISTLQKHFSLKEGHTAASPIRFPEQEIREVKFNCKPEYARRTQFDPG